MAYIGNTNYDPNKWIRDIGESFGSILGTGVEAKLAKKRKAQDENEIIKKHYTLQGWKQADNFKELEDPLAQKQKMPDGTLWVKPTTMKEREEYEFEKQKRPLELDVLRKKSSEKSLEAAAIQATVPEGTVIRKGGVTIPINPAKKETTEQRETAKASVKAKGELAGLNAMVDSSRESLERALELNKESYGGKTGSATFKTQSALNMGTNSTKFRNTAEVINIMKNQVIRDLKKTFGAQLSDEEREYLNQVYGAMESMTPVERDIAIKQVINILESKVKEAEAKAAVLGGGSAVPNNAAEFEDNDPMGLFQER